MSGAGRGLAIPLTMLALAIGAAGCGEDEEPITTVPPISVPTSEAPTVPTIGTTATPPPATTTGKGNGGGGKPNPASPDSPSNDLPPPPGSPQEAFERHCEQNPAACG